MPKHGFLFPDNIENHDLICVSLKIPNNPLYIAAFKGAIQQLEKWFNWQQEPAKKGSQVAAYWRDLLLDHMLIGDCDSMALSCSEVETCLQTSQYFSDTIKNAVTSAGAFGGSAATGGTPGQQATTQQQQADIAAGTNPTCNKDILWSQCLALVQYVNRTVMDTLEKLEVATNVVELADGIGNAIPGAAAGWDTLGIDGVADLIDYFQEAIEEQYSAQYTQAYEEELACEIFCACQDDCTITSERLFGVMSDRLDAYIANPIGTLLDLMAVISGVDWNSSLIVDATYLLAFGSFYTANLLLPGVADRALTLLLKIAVNDANDDWTLLCDECETEWSYDNDFTLGAGAWTIPGSGTGGVLGAAGIGTSQIGGGDEEGAGAEISFTESNVTSIRLIGTLVNNSRDAGGQTVSIIGNAIAPGAQQRLDTSPGIGAFDVTLNLTGTIDDIRIRIQHIVSGGTSYIERCVITGTGTKPTELT